MSGAIGPGSIVQRCPPAGAGAGRFFTVGALYRVAAIGPAGYCSIHGDIDHTLVIAGVPYPEAGAADGWCPHHFRLWPPPPDEALRNEEAPQDESIPA